MDNMHGNDNNTESFENFGNMYAKYYGIPEEGFIPEDLQPDENVNGEMSADGIMPKKKFINSAGEESAIFSVYGQTDNYENEAKPVTRQDFEAGAFQVKTGEVPGKGNFSCTNCGTGVTLTEGDRVPLCPRCGGIKFSSVTE